MAKLTLQNITSGYNLAGVYNGNNDAIEAALENTLSRDGTTPNSMEVSLDMGSNRIYNLAEPVNDNDAVRLIDLANVVGGGDVIVSPTVDWDTGITNIPATVSDIGSLVDPNADRLIFWDDSAGEIVYLTVGTGLNISGTTLTASVSSVAWGSITGTPAYVTSLGTLSDPNADRIIFWDDSAGNLAHLTVGTGLNLTGTSLTLSHLGLQSLTDPNVDRILFWDDSVGSLAWLTAGTGLTITGTSISLNSALDSLGSLTDPGADRIVFWDDSATNYANLEATGHLSISGTTLVYASQTGSFTATLTGVTGTVTGSVKYTINGNTVTLEFPVIEGTPNSTAHTLTGAPVAIHPATLQRPIGITKDNSVEKFSILQVETSGTITLFNGLTAVFSNAGTEGVGNCTITYHLS